MSCVVGMTIRDTTLIAAETAIGDPVCYGPKLKMHAGTAFGFAGSASGWSRLAYMPHSPPRNPTALPYWLANVFCPSIHSGLPDNGEEADWAVLAGRSGVLVYAAPPQQVFDDERGFMAIGCGAQYALGALRAFVPNDDAALDIDEARDILVRAVEIASEFDPYCGGRIEVLVA